MAKPVLIYGQKMGAGHVRFWRYEDGQFLFERVYRNGKGTAVFCPTFEKALELWCQSESKRQG